MYENIEEDMREFIRQRQKEGHTVLLKDLVYEFGTAAEKEIPGVIYYPDTSLHLPDTQES